MRRLFRRSCHCADVVDRAGLGRPGGPGVASGAQPLQPPSPPCGCRSPGSGPVVRFIQLRFHPVDESLIEPQTYLYYIQTQPSRSSDGVWVPYDEAAEQKLRDDFRRLWGTNFLDNLWVEVIDEPYDNGVIGKRVIFHMEERPRVKIVDYTGSSKVERTKIDEKMKELGVTLRLDSFLDDAAVRRVEGHHPGDDGREGLPVRRDHLERRGAARRPEAGQGHLRRAGGPEGPGPRASTSSATRRSATARCAAR